MEQWFFSSGGTTHVKCQTNSQITTQCIAKMNVCLFSFCLNLGREAKGCEQSARRVGYPPNPSPSILPRPCSWVQYNDYWFWWDPRSDGGSSWSRGWVWEPWASPIGWGGGVGWGRGDFNDSMVRKAPVNRIQPPTLCHVQACNVVRRQKKI